MIKANDLRIGNVVSLHGAEDTLATVTAIHAMDAETKKFLEQGGMNVTDTHFVVLGDKGTIVLCSFLLPVAISEKLLLKLEFEKILVGDVPVYSYWKKNNKLSLLYNSKSKDFLYDNPFYNCIYNSLHELQNLFHVLNKKELCLQMLYAANVEPSTSLKKLKK